MRLSVNLATKPFIELRPLFAKLRIAMAALALLAIGLGVGSYFLSQRARAARAQMDALKARTLVFQNERQENERRMQQPQNRAVLDRSKFLNGLFTHKSFSWTSVMVDLEGVLPAGVQITNIEPVITAGGDVSIRMHVSGDRDHAVEFVKNLEQSHRFRGPRLANETAHTQDEHGTPLQVSQNVAGGGVEFEITSGYNPLPTPKGDAKKDDAKGKTPLSSKSSSPKAGSSKAASSPKAVKPAAPKAARPQGVVRTPVNGGAR